MIRSGGGPMWGNSSPMPRAVLRLVRALTVEHHEAWIETIGHLNMDLLKEHKKEALRQAA